VKFSSEIEADCSEIKLSVIFIFILASLGAVVRACNRKEFNIS
jgi:hypothetical protein